ncbi:methionine adenosyltransferase [Trueperella pyogenes]|uniref:methionine adenosyltransferase n=1 Tax=Trueperella pyogenes TaxID=1661 RepID=UPI000D52BC37|nr:methionine adenosyltransferase [Trueperella pyogenes]AWG03413.1 methionine adenosyltransferase [Trueperella pyogenes]AWG16144.1 methionine adenosyltransferase [Trueperella pyogenes]AZR05027.1 methionine adenosyltransferase [Trueperella pyogenes]
MTIKTAEAVCIGHPDKLCDLIAETILDDITHDDPTARVAVEVTAKGRHIHVFGEITTKARLRIRSSVAFALEQAGYQPWRFRTHLNVKKQSPEIASGVTTSLEARAGDDDAFVLLGAGDQGTVYGYATAENDDMLPTPLVVAHEICRRIDQARTDHLIAGLKPDGKAQVSIRYNGDVPVEATAIVVSVQHDKNKDLEELERELRSLVIEPALGNTPLAPNALVLINPAGTFIKGGPAADAGLTGRKLAVDTYGGLGAHGGGAFAGKDVSKVDRTAALMARRIAKTIIAAELATEATVAISYAIGKADPVAFSVNTHGTTVADDDLITRACEQLFPLRPAAMIDFLHLRGTRFARFATYGYFEQPARWEHQYSNARDLFKAVKNLEIAETLRR